MLWSNQTRQCLLSYACVCNCCLHLLSPELCCLDAKSCIVLYRLGKVCNLTHRTRTNNKDSCGLLIHWQAMLTFTIFRHTLPVSWALTSRRITPASFFWTQHQSRACPSLAANPHGNLWTELLANIRCLRRRARAHVKLVGLGIATPVCAVLKMGMHFVLHIVLPKCYM